MPGAQARPASASGSPPPGSGIRGLGARDTAAVGVLRTSNFPEQVSQGPHGWCTQKTGADALRMRSSRVWARLRPPFLSC